MVAMTASPDLMLRTNPPGGSHSSAAACGGFYKVKRQAATARLIAYVILRGRPAGSSRGSKLMEHRVAYKVYYEDTDCLGVVYYANYLKYLERGRTEFVGAQGRDIRD